LAGVRIKTGTKTEGFERGSAGVIVVDAAVLELASSSNAGSFAISSREQRQQHVLVYVEESLHVLRTMTEQAITRVAEELRALAIVAKLCRRL
jgi:hypothetical protein